MYSYICYLVEHGDCFFSHVHGYIWSCCQQKGLKRVGINIQQTVIVSSLIFIFLIKIVYPVDFLLYVNLMGCFFYLHRFCASTSLLICAESQVEAKIKNDLYKCMYLYISILKRTNMAKLNVWIYGGGWTLLGHWEKHKLYKSLYSIGMTKTHLYQASVI